MTEGALVLNSEVPVASPLWWVLRLYEKLQVRRDLVTFFDDYYSGRHPLPWLAPQAREEFRRILEMTRSNYMGLVCDAVVERVNVEGFRFGPDDKADDETWRIWQFNHLDQDSDTAWLESTISGVSHFKVSPNEDDPRLPYIHVVHASQVIVEHVPGTNRRQRAAALEVWEDDWTGDLRATLYLPDDADKVLRVYKYRAERRKPVTTGTTTQVTSYKPEWKVWEQRDEEWGGPIPELSVVPIIEIPNNPRLLTGGISELYDLTDIQDRINKTLADRLITQDYGAFPQKWISAWPEEDAAGNPTPPIDVGRNRILTTDIKEAKFGQFAAAEVDPYSMAKREDVKDIASRSRTPAQYLLGELTNVNGETLKASESGLVSKVKQRRKPWGESTEETMRLARQLAGLSGTDEKGNSTEHMMETIWSNPEYRTEGELVDAVVKKLQVGIASLRQAREDAGYSVTQIKRLEEEDRQQSLNTLEPLMQRALRPDQGLSNGTEADAADALVQ